MEEEHHPFPEKLAFLLNNPIRRFFWPPDRVLEKIEVSREHTVIDFGCGPGFFTIPLARKSKRVIAIDVSHKLLERAKEYATKEGVQVDFIESNGKELGLEDDTADIIFLNYVFHETKDKPLVLTEFRRVLKPTGKLVIVERTKPGLIPIGPPLVDSDELTSLLEESGFEVIEKIPNGKAAIFIAKKG